MNFLKSAILSGFLITNLSLQACPIDRIKQLIIAIAVKNNGKLTVKEKLFTQEAFFIYGYHETTKDIDDQSTNVNIEELVSTQFIYDLLHECIEYNQKYIDAFEDLLKSENHSPESIEKYNQLIAKHKSQRSQLQTQLEKLVASTPELQEKKEKMTETPVDAQKETLRQQPSLR